jgi:hypothetical protein
MAEDEDPLYLHLETGQVMSFGALEPEIAGWIWSGLNDGWLVVIEPLPASVRGAWRQEFAASMTDGLARARLHGALMSKRPTERWKKVLNRHPEERRRWLAFHDARVQQATEQWLADRGIPVTGVSPVGYSHEEGHPVTSPSPPRAPDGAT